MLVTDSLLAYTLAATLLTLTPGLDTALILRTATAEGGPKRWKWTEIKLKSDKLIVNVVVFKLCNCI